MKLTIFNGSPRLGSNNTELMAEAFKAGYLEAAGAKATCECFKLNRLGPGDAGLEVAADIFDDAECILIAFPLYSYAMPAGVKAFFEVISERAEHSGRHGVPKKLGFLVQYGFREAVHARPLELYLEQLTEQLGCDYMGTVIKGGCDGLYKNPKDWVNRKILEGARELGKSLGREGVMNEALLRAYALPETESRRSIWLMKLMVAVINQVYWKAQLRQNNAVAQSFARPYEDVVSKTGRG